MSISGILNITSDFNIYTSDHSYIAGTLAVSIVSVVAFAIFKCIPRRGNHAIRDGDVIKKWEVKDGNELKLIKNDKDLVWVFLRKLKINNTQGLQLTKFFALKPI